MNTHQRAGIPTRSTLRGLILAIGIVSSIACAQTVTSGNSTTTVHQSGGNSGSRSEVIQDAHGHRVVTTDGRSTDITIQHDGGGDSAARQALRPANAVRTETPFDHQRFDSRRFDDRESATQPHDTDIPAREAFRQQMLERMRISPLR